MCERLDAERAQADVAIMAGAAPYMSEVFDGSPDIARTARHLTTIHTHYVATLNAWRKRERHRRRRARARVHAARGTDDGEAQAQAGSSGASSEPSPPGDEKAAAADDADTKPRGKRHACTSLVPYPPRPPSEVSGPDACGVPAERWHEREWGDNSDTDSSVGEDSDLDTVPADEVELSVDKNKLPAPRLQQRRRLVGAGDEAEAWSDVSSDDGTGAVDAALDAVMVGDDGQPESRCVPRCSCPLHT